LLALLVRVSIGRRRTQWADDVTQRHSGPDRSLRRPAALRCTAASRNSDADIDNMASLSTDDSASLSSTLTLACGQTLPNRTVKAALSECMADGSTNLPNKELHTLYARWAKGGIGETRSSGGGGGNASGTF
jgi:hypothetical protein